MFEHKGIWLPDGEKHFPEYFDQSGVMVDGKAAYQWEKVRVALEPFRVDPHVRPRRVAVDVGAHVGLWSMHLAPLFQQVEAFEPIARHRECFERNVAAANVRLHPVALGEQQGTVEIFANPESSGGSRVQPSGGTHVPVERLDAFNLAAVDFLKIDCEGFEYFVLKGAEQTLLRCRPVIIVEQRTGLPADYGLRPLQAVEYLRSLGAEQFHPPMVDDYFLYWPEAA